VIVSKKTLMLLQDGKVTGWWLSIQTNAVLTITNKKNPVKHNYLLHNHTLESVSSAKYLGIILQSDLKWTQHTNNIVANANKKSWILEKKP
jgi:hypothetical protein